MGSLDKYFGTVDNPAYDPDGDEPSLAINGAGGVETHETPVFKEEKIDKKSLPHQIKFMRRRSISRPCIITIIALILVLLGLAIAVFFVVKSSQLSSTQPEIREVWEVEGRFRLLSSEYTSELDDPTSSQYRTLTAHVEDVVLSVFPTDGSSVSVSHVVVTDLRAGSVHVTYHVVFTQPYNVTYAETQVEELFFLAARSLLPNREHIQIADLTIDMQSVTFSALVDLVTTTRFTAKDQASETTPTLGVVTTAATTEAPRQCELIEIEMCQNHPEQINYTSTVFPNHLHHDSQMGADRDVWHYNQVLRSDCHPYIRRFTCGALTPECTESVDGMMVGLPLCRTFCEEVEQKCSAYFSLRFSALMCSLLPDSEDPTVCLSAPAIERLPLRLSGGLGPKEGHVEVFVDGAWGVICDTMWNDWDASVVCRQLAIPGKAKALKGSHFGANSKTITYHNVQCHGDESHLSMCDMDEGRGPFCDHTRSAGVICDAENRDVELPIRLAGGPSPTSGRLEVFYNNTWGTVCQTLFGDAEATTVCNMLNEPFQGTIKEQSDVSIPESTGPIWLNDVTCTGGETSIADCTHDGWGGHRYCRHSDDVYIQCTETVEVAPGVPELEARLADGPSAREGRIEIHYQNEWGTICRGQFDERNAGVYCRTLGFSSEGAIFQRSRYGGGTGRVWLSEVYCQGTEQSITDCHHSGWGQNSCPHLNDISVSCRPLANATLETTEQIQYATTVSSFESDTTELPAKNESTELPVESRTTAYLADTKTTQSESETSMPSTEPETTASPGENGEPTTVAHVEATMESVEANPTTDMITTTERRRETTTDFTTLPGLFPGREETTTFGFTTIGFKASTGFTTIEGGVVGGDLPTSYSTDGSTVATVQHQTSLELVTDAVTTEPPPEFLARLADSTDPTEGRLEVYDRGDWGTVCMHDFDNIDATIACHMMGFVGSGLYLDDHYGGGPSTQPIVMDHVQCEGTEESLFDCVMWAREDLTCSHTTDVSIKCNITIDFETLDVRLQDGHNNNQGFVQVQHNGEWGTVCKQGFNDVAATVVCTILGYSTEGKVLPKDSQYSSRIWLSDVQCNGQETSLLECAHEIDNNNCDHWDDSVYISCDSIPVRLVGGSTDWEGRAEVQVNGIWGSVCTSFTDRPQTATVVCHALGYNVTVDSVEVLSDGSIPADPTLPILMSDVECRGDEADISHCPHIGQSGISFCDHDEDLTIRCTLPNANGNAGS